MPRAVPAMDSSLHGLYGAAGVHETLESLFVSLGRKTGMDIDDVRSDFFAAFAGSAGKTSSDIIFGILTDNFGLPDEDVVKMLVPIICAAVPRPN